MSKTFLFGLLIPLLAFGGTVVNKGDQTQIGNFGVRAAAGTQSASAIFEVSSTTKGSVSIPKMTTTQRDAISSPTEGLQIYNTTTHALNYYDGSAWQAPSLASALVPTGAVMPFTHGTAPTGFLNCDGTAVSRATYSALFALIGITHGQGNGTTTFNLPNYQGRFLRMVDGSAGVDPDKASRTAMATGGNTGNNVGSVQAGEYANHTHTAPGSMDGGTLANWASGIYKLGVGTSTQGGTWNQLNSSGGNETRPVNAYVNYIIKY